MILPLLLDTHVWLWWLLGQPELSAKERDALDALAAAGTPPCLSSISLWEAQMLVAKGRLKINAPLHTGYRLLPPPNRFPCCQWMCL